MKKAVAICLALSVNLAYSMIDAEQQNTNQLQQDDINESDFSGLDNILTAHAGSANTNNDINTEKEDDIFKGDPWNKCITDSVVESVKSVEEHAPHFVAKNDFKTMAEIFRPYIAPLIVELSRSYVNSPVDNSTVKNTLLEELGNLEELTLEKRDLIENFAKNHCEQLNSIIQSYVTYKKIRIFADKTELDNMSQKTPIGSLMNESSALNAFVQNLLIDCFEFDFKKTIETNSKKLNLVRILAPGP